MNYEINNITAIEYNFQTETGYTGKYEIDENDVIDIQEHSARGEGDKWYYDVIFSDKQSKVRIFNPCKVYYNNDYKPKRLQENS